MNRTLVSQLRDRVHVLSSAVPICTLKSHYMLAMLEPETFPSFALQCRAESSKMVSRYYLFFPKRLHCSKETQINWYMLGSHSSLFSPQSLGFMGFKEVFWCLEKFGSINKMSPVFSSHENACQVTCTNISRTVIIQSGRRR